METRFSGRVGLQQRVLPTYRVAFFERLARLCPEGLGVFAGLPRPAESIRPANSLANADLTHAHNLHLFAGSCYLCYQVGLRSWLERWSPSVLIMEANPRYLSSGTAVRWMHHRGRPVIGWGLGAPPASGPLADIRTALRRRFVGQFDAMIAYSEQGANEYIGLGASPERTFVALNAVAARPAPPPVRPPLRSRRPRVLFVGRLQERKRVDLLLEACSQIPTAPDLMIVGDGPDRDRLEAFASEIYPQAQFVGPRFGAELQEYFAWADLFILPGTGGLAVQEAMAAGLPVLVARGDGTQRDLISGNNGWLLPSDDLEALIAAMTKAFSNPDRLRAMGERSYRLVVERFNIETMSEVFVQAMNAVSGG